MVSDSKCWYKDESITDANTTPYSAYDSYSFFLEEPSTELGTCSHFSSFNADQA